MITATGANELLDDGARSADLTELQKQIQELEQQNSKLTRMNAGLQTRLRVLVRWAANSIHARNSAA
jgi:FtsZ-binding cell division protein ZapB